MHRPLTQPELTFQAFDLDDLRRPDALSLTVPTFRDIVQISAAYTDGRATLDVIAEAEAVTVRRQDGQALQVQINGHLSDFEADESLHHPVFVEPVPEVSFGLLENGRWYLTDRSIRVFGAAARVSVFADTIGYYASQKQRRQ